MTIDWSQIKNEYVTTKAGYRDIAKKFGVSLGSIVNHAKGEHWGEQREQFYNSVQTETLENAKKDKIDRAARMVTMTDLLTDRFLDALTNMDMNNVAALRTVASALKDLREMQGLNKTALDIEEQKARIAKLRKEAESEEHDSKVEVVIKGADDYCE